MTLPSPPRARAPPPFPYANSKVAFRPPCVTRAIWRWRNRADRRQRPSASSSSSFSASFFPRCMPNSARERTHELATTDGIRRWGVRSCLIQREKRFCVDPPVIYSGWRVCDWLENWSARWSCCSSHFFHMPKTQFHCKKSVKKSIKKCF